MTSFYDWYADLPVASPQVFGDQTDVPESGDWWDATYLMMWGSNVPVTRTPDAHWMAEVRYRGTKVVTVSPDYADNTKFADEWLPARPGTDGALAMAMGHVILKEFFVDRRVPFFVDYVQQYTDLPFLVTLEERDGALRAGQVPHRRRPRRSDVRGRGVETVLLDGRDRRPSSVPNGLAGLPLRRLRRGQVEPRPRRPGPGVDRRGDPARRDRGGAAAALRHAGRARRGAAPRGVPVRRVGEQLVTTVFDLMLAQYGVHRPGCPATWPTGYDDAAEPYTPAWQEPITGVSAAQAIRVAREFARNAEESGGRSMIIMGAGICQWFHGDATYRAVLALLLLTGSMGRNGGGWAHYVGQEKCRPVTGWATMAMAHRLVPAAAADDRHRVLVHAHRPVALRRLPGRRARLARWAGAASPACTPWTRSPRRRRWAGCRSTRSSTATSLDVADEADAGRAGRCPPTSPNSWPRAS